MDETTGITNKDYEIIVHLVKQSKKHKINGKKKKKK